MADTLLIKINATTETLKAELAEAKAVVKGFADKIGVDLKAVDAHFSRLNTGVSKTGAIMAGAAGGGVALLGEKLLELPYILAEVIKKANEYAASLKDTAAGLGVGTTFLQQFRNAALDNGATLAGADQALGKFTQSLGAAFNGASKAAVANVTTALKGTGTTLAELAKLSETDRFLAVADGLSRIKDPAQRSAVAMKLFGESYKQVLPLLTEGREGWRRSAEEAAKFGVVLSESQIAHANETASKIEQLNRALQTRIASIVADNAEAIGSLANAIANLSAEVVQFLSSNPQLALSLIGGLGGAAVGGPIGAGVGFTGGYLTGAKVAKSQADGNMDIGFRRKALDASVAELRAREAVQSGNGRSGSLFNFRRDQNPGGDSGGTIDSARQEVRRQAALADRAVYLVKHGESPAAAVGNATVTPPKGPKARKARAVPVDRFDADLARAQGDLLQAQLGLAVDAGERARIQQALLAADTREANARVAESKDLSAAEKARLTAINAQVAQARGDVIDRQRDETLAQQSLDIRLGDVANQRTLLQGTAALARTAAERRIAELRLLDLQIQEEGARQDAIIASSTSTTAEKEIARRRIAQLPQEKAQAATQIARGAQSPLESYLDGIPDTAARVNEALENIAANGLQSLNDGIADAIVGGKSLGATFKSIANQIIGDLIRIAVQKSITGPLASLLGGGGNSGIGALLGSIKFRAGGGPVTAGHPYVVGERGPELIIPRMSASVISNDNFRGGGGSGGPVQVQVQARPSKYFDLHVTTIAGGVVQQAAPAIAGAAAQGVVSELTRAGLPYN